MTFSMSFKSVFIFTSSIYIFIPLFAAADTSPPETCAWQTQDSHDVCVCNGKYDDSTDQSKCSGPNLSQQKQTKADASSKANSTASADLNACIEQHNTAIGPKGDGAQGSKCDWQSDGLIKAANSQLGQLALTAGSMSPAAACNGLGEASKYANAAVAGFNMSCKMAVGKCTDACAVAVKSCDAAKAKAREADAAASCTLGDDCANYAAVEPGCKKPISPDTPRMSAHTVADGNEIDCKVFSEKVAVNAGAIVMLAINNNQNLANCNKLQQMIGQAGPSAPGVTPGDCTNPANAGNPVCAGLHANAVGNFGGATIAGSGVGVGGARAGAAISGVAGGGLAGMGLPSDLGSNVAKSAAAGGLATAGAGGGGGGAVGGGGGLGGGAAKKKAAGAPADPRDTKMYGGLVTGAGSGSGSSGSSSSGDNGSGKKAVFGAQYANQPGATPPGFDANKYNPNMKYEGGRNLAGVTGPDGITGPNSNLFNKVNSQFNEQTMQDRFFAP